VGSACAGSAGFEPALRRLGGGCSVLLSYEPLEAPRPDSNWRDAALQAGTWPLGHGTSARPRLESNQRSPPSEGGALSTALRGLAWRNLGSNQGCPEGDSFTGCGAVRRSLPPGEDDGSRTR
jgi:hypothetical protein